MANVLAARRDRRLHLRDRHLVLGRILAHINADRIAAERVEWHLIDLRGIRIGIKMPKRVDMRRRMVAGDDDLRIERLLVALGVTVLKVAQHLHRWEERVQLRILVERLREIMAQRVTEAELQTTILAPDGTTFWESAKQAGYPVQNWRDSSYELDGLTGWIEVHIEQGRVLQDTGNRIGIVHAIAGYVHGDFHFTGRADHAGATPMDFRLDASIPAAETILEVQRLANEIGDTTVGTTAEIESFPSLINVVPGGVRVSLDTRSVSGGHLTLRDQIVAYAEERAKTSGCGFEWVERQGLPVTPMDEGIVAALRVEAEATGEPFMVMPSGAAHDTMCVADRVPTAMVFVPCKDGLSHTPLEDADTADAALAAEIILGAIMSLQS